MSGFYGYNGSFSSFYFLSRYFSDARGLPTSVKFKMTAGTMLSMTVGAFKLSVKNTIYGIFFNFT